MSYFRPNVEAMSGYVPGEQPKGKPLLKLNTNENPYPPSPLVEAAIRDFPVVNLKRYPIPLSDPVREAAESVYNIPKSMTIVGNGSDDVLTILFRSFVGQGEKVGWFSPSYSLYPVLADIQGAVGVSVALGDAFGLPDNAAAKAKGCKLFFITRPNAPTGNAFQMDKVLAFVKEFEGVVCIDEAYADFCDDNCLALVKEFDNVVVTRSLSKSYSLAGIRCGLGFACENLINGMHKVRDSYNVNAITQAVAAAALKDRESFERNTAAIIATRESVSKRLTSLGFSVCPSSSNFLFCIPPIDAETFVEEVRNEGYLIRYFKTPGISQYVRISIGSDSEMDGFLSKVKAIVAPRKTAKSTA